MKVGRDRKTHYASPPHVPSSAMSRKTIQKLATGLPSPKTPTADSKPRKSMMKPWSRAGRKSKREGSGGIPMEIEDREKKTVVW